MPSLADLTRAWLLRQLGLASSTLTEADLQTALYGQSVSGNGAPANVQFNTGRYYGAAIDTTMGTAAPVLNRLWVTPFVVGRQTTFDRIAAEITTAGTLANVCRLGVYDTVNGIPTNLLLDAGTIDGTVIAVAEKIINLTLGQGLYWLAFVSQVGTVGQVRAIGSAQSAYIADTTYPGANSFKSYRVDAVAGALPAAFGVPVADTTAPRVCLRAA